MSKFFYHVKGICVLFGQTSITRFSGQIATIFFFTRVCFVALAVSTLILPPSMIPTVVKENTSSLAFAIPPDCGTAPGGGPGCPDRDGDSIPDVNDVCPDDPDNRCYLKCDGFWRCIGTFFDWAIRNLGQGAWRIAQNLWVSIVGGEPTPFEGYESPFERKCKNEGGEYFDGTDHGTYGGDVLEFCYIKPKPTN